MRKGSVEVIVAILLFAFVAGFGIVVADLRGIRSDIQILTKTLAEKNSGGEVATKTAEVAPMSLLEKLGTVDVAPLSQKVIAFEYFVENTNDDTKPKIAYLGENFKKWFIEKSEDNLNKTTLSYYKLLDNALDETIISNLGGQEKAETTLSEMFFLLRQQGKGEAGCLLVNGYANIFYIRDVTGTLRAVLVRWYGVGWYVRADEVSDPRRWSAGSQVFPRNS